MARAPKSGQQTFDSEWQKAVAWAQSNGIGANSYLPVYQLDLTRLQNGEYPMGAAERNLAIMAAHNPNQVVSAPQDNPTGSLNPKSIMTNAVSDAGKIATGIAGIFTGSFEKQVWDSAKATYKAVDHPATQMFHGTGSQAGINSFMGTIGNWLNNTLLAYAPGAADIGTVLQTDAATHYGNGVSPLSDPGTKKLLEHPLVSVLDLIPGEGGVATKVADRVGATGVAASLAARGGDRSAAGEIAHQIGSVSTGGKPGVTLHGDLVAKLSVKDRIEKMAGRLGPGGAGVGPAMGNLAEAIDQAGAMTSQMYTWLLDAPSTALRALGPEDVSALKKVLDTRRTTGGDSVREALKDPTFSPAARDVLQMWVNGPLRFATEAELFAGNLRPIVSLNGDVGMWATAGKGVRKVLAASNARRAAQRAAVESLDALEPHVDRLKALDAMRTQASGAFQSRLQAARQQVFQDPELQRPLTQEVSDPSRFRQARSLSRTEQLHAVVGEGGIADQFLEQIAKSSDPDLIGTLAQAMKERLRAWGPKSVNAAEHPALQALYSAADDFDRWAKLYHKEQREIDKAVYGEEKAAAHHLELQKRFRAQRVQVLKDRQTKERDELLSRYQMGKRQRTAKLGKMIQDTTERRIWHTEMVRTQGDAEARRATKQVLEGQIMPRVRQKERDFKDASAKSIKEATRKLQDENKLEYTKFERDRSKMSRRHADELRKEQREQRVVTKGMGEVLADSVRYGDAIRAFHDAVMDNPADQYRDVFVALIQKHIKESEETAALTVATDRYLKTLPGMTAKRLAKIRENPDVVNELTMAHFHEIMNQPDLSPQVAEDAKAEMEEYRTTAHEELKLLIGQGLKVPYIPSATSFDETLGRDSMAPLIGHGIPKPDMAKEKVWELTPHKDDFALGINKAVVQALQRDSTIYLAEHYLKPMTLTQEAVNGFLWVFKAPEMREAGGNIPHELQSQMAKDLGLEKFDPKGMFGFQLPRWSQAENLYLPKSIVGALKEFEKQRRKSLLGKSNKVFRYSILGLSPRYTAHIIFGGSMMLALRSTPYAVTMIGDAARALRDGTLPRDVFSGRETELGFQEPINLVNREMGKDMINGLAVPEHIETRQQVKMAAAKPIHVLRALADINFRFTHYIRDMQAAVAYLDGAGKVDRRGGRVTVEDPETGKNIDVSSERAVKEGIHHVQEVFGNLKRMSPVERQIAQTVMPFYGWQKHILGYVMSFPFDHPYRALVLSQLAFHSSQDVPLGWPIRMQLLMFMGSPDGQGNVNAIDMRSLDPFRDVANYATWTGVFESLNPALSAPLAAAFGPQAIYGSSSLYPGVTYNAFYGIETSTSGGSWINALEQWVPQAGAAVSAAQAAGGIRSEWQTDKSSAVKSLLESLNVPFVTPPVNLKQIAAKDEDARFETAKNVAYDAFSSGNFATLAGYKTVPNPLNTAYEITPQALEALYRQSQQANPGVAPIEALLPPQTPYGW
jgi:hypothetical protein